LGRRYAAQGSRRQGIPFLNFGAFGYDTPQSGPVPFFTPAFTWATAGRTRMQIARVGLNYKFD
jgi:hypothetical protein